MADREVGISQNEFDRVLRIVKRFVRGHEDAEDTTIEIVTRSWVAGIAHSGFDFIRLTSFEALRKRQRREKLMTTLRSEYTQTSVSPADVISDHIERAKVVLTRQERTMIWYRFYLELTIAEVADRMKLSTATVSVVIRQGLEKMRKELSNEKVDHGSDVVRFVG